MDSPVRQQQKRNDYLRHKLFRKINRRRRAKRQQEIEAPVKELKKRLRQKRTFEDGKDGDISDQQYYSIMERVANENNPIWNEDRRHNGQQLLSVDEDLLRILNDNSYDYRGYYNKYPNSRANADTHWTDEFKTVYHPTFSVYSRYSGKKSQYNPEGILGGQWNDDQYIPAWGQRLPTYTIGKDGNINQNGVDQRGAFDVIYDSFGRPSLGQIWNKTKTIVGDIAHFFPRHYGGTVVNMYDNDVASWGQVVGDAIKMYSDKVQHTPDPPRQQRRWNTRRRVQHNRSHPQFTNKEIGIGGKGIGMLVSIPGIIQDWNQLKKDWNKPVSEYANGKDSGIHIKPENRGKFTRLKKRTGHSTAWFKAHGTPAQKKMATFAQNAKKWHH